MNCFRKKTGFICIISILFALLLETSTAITNFPYSYLNSMKCKLTDFTFYDCQLDSDGETVITTGYDPSIYISFPETYIQSLRIVFEETPEELWDLHIYYGRSGEAFSEKNSVANWISGNVDEKTITLNETAGQLRVDLGSEDGRTFRISNISINPLGRIIHYISVIGEQLSLLRIILYAAILICIAQWAINPPFRAFLIKRFCTVLFCLAIIMGIIQIDHSTRSPNLYDSEGNADFPSYTQAYESWLNNNIGYRKQLIDLRSVVSYRLMGISPSEQVAVGKEGWLFYTGEDNIEIAKGTYPMEWEDYVKAALSMQKVKDSLNEQGIDFLVVLPCSKVSIYPEYLAGDYDIIETPTDFFKNAVELCTDIDLVYLKDTLLNAKKNEQIYYKTDTHWNFRGALAAYQKIYDFLASRNYVSNRFPETYTESTKHDGDVGNMIGSSIVVPDDDDAAVYLANPSAYPVESGQTYETLMELKDQYGISEIRMYKNDSISGKKLLIWGDSFLQAWNMPEYFAENFSEVIYIWSPIIGQDIIDICQPDLVIYEKGERELQYLNSYMQQYLIPNNIK